MTNFQRAIESNPDDSDAYIWLGKGYYFYKEVNKAIETWKKAIEVDDQAVYAYNSLADLYAQQGQYAEAIAYYHQALAVPDQQGIPVSAHTLAHNGLGEVLQEQGNLEGAIKEYQESIRLDPSFAHAQKNLEEVQKKLVTQ
jgi:superkiller protein 3